ncbi:hypothetical protein ASPBRDRAFT_388718 [Aspergillus brasiliensis CBS 101740]|uniref:Uncharacterized protein n=1 Tax=Aspergillus brasiliensis (strain CBS 101740 / IMI 381727 / IBT 21946) TaxID=767769 RepID=A0A1L9UWA6_ASPBC|nr:hypothetical protein ASPBRDRAFT_388718 [Aspergillus brasiliensis CBS 101740]
MTALTSRYQSLTTSFDDDNKQTLSVCLSCLELRMDLIHTYNIHTYIHALSTYIHTYIHAQALISSLIHTLPTQTLPFKDKESDHMSPDAHVHTPSRKRYGYTMDTHILLNPPMHRLGCSRAGVAVPCPVRFDIHTYIHTYLYTHTVTILFSAILNFHFHIISLSRLVYQSIYLSIHLLPFPLNFFLAACHLLLFYTTLIAHYTLSTRCQPSLLISSYILGTNQLHT